MKVRNATWAATQTSKVPNRVAFLFIFYSVLAKYKLSACEAPTHQIDESLNTYVINYIWRKNPVTSVQNNDFYIETRTITVRT